MDRKTLDIGSARAVAEQLRTEILDALASGESLTARELMDRCETAEDIERMTNALAFLQRKTGQVKKDGMREPTAKTRGAKPAPTYCLADPPTPTVTHPLSAVIESTTQTAFAHAAAPPEPDEFAPETPEDVAAAVERAWDILASAPADTQWPDAIEGQLARGAGAAAEAQDGDEFAAAPLPRPAYKPAAVAFRSEGTLADHQGKSANFAARYIAALDDPEPRLLEARWIADLLGAVAGRLEAGRSLPPDPEAVRLLREAEAILLEVAA